MSKDICEYQTTNMFDGIFSKDALFHLPDADLNKAIRNFYKMLNKQGKLLLILDIPKEDGEKIYIEPLDKKFSLYYNYLSVDKTKNLLLQNNFHIDEVKIVNDSNYEYAKGIMFIYASK